METPDYSGFLRHFSKQWQRPLPIIAGARELDSLRAHERRALLASLQRFQLGESGEGRVAQQVDGVHLPGVDADFRAALKLFIREEGRHAAILGRMVSALGGGLLRRNWTASAFKAGRHLLGVRVKLVVVLAAEVGGAAFYEGLGEVLPPGAIRGACAELARDEGVHLAFLACFFRAQTPSAWRRLAFRALFGAVLLCAFLCVRADHRKTLAFPGMRFGHRFWRKAAATVAEVARPQPVAAAVQRAAASRT